MRRLYQLFVVFVGVLLILLLIAPDLEGFLVNGDHGWQLSMGVAALAGDVPGLDALSFYGPMVAYASAVGLLLSPGIWGDTLICATGFALTLTLMFAFMRRHAGWAWALSSMCWALWLLCRFYKWYYWLFPLLLINLLDRLIDVSPERRARIGAFIGLSSGLAWSFRYDLGLAMLLFSLITLILAEWRTPGIVSRELLKHVGCLLAGFAVVPLLWFAVLFANGGTTAITFYLRATVEGVLSVAQDLARPLPRFDVSRPFSSHSRIAGLYMTVAALYAVSAVVVLFDARRGREATHWRALALACGAGLVILPQAMHRSDPHHLLHVIPPAILTAHLLLQQVWKHPVRARAMTFARRTVATLLAVLFVVGALLWHAWAAIDFRRPTWPPWQKHVELAKGLNSDIDHPVARAMRAVELLTQSPDAILAFPFSGQYYALTGRRPAGAQTQFMIGAWNEGMWRDHVLAVLTDDRPALVVVSEKFLEPVSPPPRHYLESFRASHPHVEAWIKEHYPTIAYHRNGILLLTP